MKNLKIREIVKITNWINFVTKSKSSVTTSFKGKKLKAALIEYELDYVRVEFDGEHLLTICVTPTPSSIGVESIIKKIQNIL